MVVLVLKDARLPPAELEPPRLAFDRLEIDDDGLRASDVRDETGEGEAALRLDVSRGGLLDDRRVAQHQLRAGLARIAVPVHHHEPLVDADLRRREAYAA